MIGEKYIDIDASKPINTNRMLEVLKMFGMTENPYTIARRLVALNNEVYESRNIASSSEVLKEGK